MVIKLNEDEQNKLKKIIEITFDMEGGDRTDKIQEVKTGFG